MAGATGLEPATSGVTGRRSNQLSYAPAASTGATTPTPFGRRVSSEPRSNRAEQRGQESLFYGTSTSSSRPSTRSRRRSMLSSWLCIDAKWTFNAAKSPCGPATSRSNAPRRVMTSSSLRSTRSKRSSCRAHEIENLGILDHYSLMQSRCRAVVGDDGLEPPTLSV